jgi:CubicO group peptidase (beta-lactamase class C family)
MRQNARRTVNPSVLTSGLVEGVAVPDSVTHGALPPDLRQRLLARMEKLEVPALAVAAVRNGEVLFADAFGYASLPFRVPVNGTPHPPIPQYPSGFFARYCW